MKRLRERNRGGAEQLSTRQGTEEQVCQTVRTRQHFQVGDEGGSKLRSRCAPIWQAESVCADQIASEVEVNLQARAACVQLEA